MFSSESGVQDFRIYWSGNEDPEGEFPALFDRPEGAETESGWSDIRQPRQEEMQTVFLWKLEGDIWWLKKLRISNPPWRWCLRMAMNQESSSSIHGLEKKWDLCGSLVKTPEICKDGKEIVQTF